MTTLNDFLQKHPVKPIRLYRPDPKDWFKDVMCYLNRPRDWQRRVNLLRMRAEVLDCVDDPDEDLARYRDEVHGKLSEAEQDMKRVRIEVTELIGQLPDADQQTAMIRRYMGFQSWKEIAWAMDTTSVIVQDHHAKALSVLKRVLVARGLIPDTYVRKKHRTAEHEAADTETAVDNNEKTDRIHGTADGFNAVGGFSSEHKTPPM